MLLALVLAAKMVAVLEFKNSIKGAEREQVNAPYFTDVVRSVVRKTDAAMTVITRENIEVLIRSQGKKLEDCEGQCEVDTGKNLGADYVITGELLKIGSTLKLKMTLYDTANGQFLNGEQAIYVEKRDKPNALRYLTEYLPDASPGERDRLEKLIEWAKSR